MPSKSHVWTPAGNEVFFCFSGIVFLLWLKLVFVFWQNSFLGFSDSETQLLGVYCSRMRLNVVGIRVEGFRV